jgi:hypothetical protein
LAAFVGRKIVMTLLSNELLYAIVQNLNIYVHKPELVALSTTNHVLSDAALDVLWAEPTVWNLAKCMDESIWSIEEVEEDRVWRRGATTIKVMVRVTLLPSLMPYVLSSATTDVGLLR